LEEAEEDRHADQPSLGCRSEHRKAQDSRAEAHDYEQVQRPEFVCEEIGGDSPDNRGGIEDGQGVSDEDLAELVLLSKNLFGQLVILDALVWEQLAWR